MTSGERPIVITGGCGFIGCNIADALAARGDRVTVVDSLTRPGARENAEWLLARRPGAIVIETADVRDAAALDRLIAGCRGVLHLAAQVAVTTSVADPRTDFEINALGGLNVLESVRLRSPDAPVVFASTNKVYGRLLDDADVRNVRERCEPDSDRLRSGVDESAPLDFYSPYGCSKGAADQYVRDYGRMFGLKTVVLRMSCIYGPRQFGTEDQGWIAHFMRQAQRGAPITIYGDGRQVRDALHVDDAVRAWMLAFDHAAEAAGRVFNLGGGPQNTLSLLELMRRLDRGRARIAHAAPRPGDQRWYVSNTGAFAEAFGWRPEMELDRGLDSLQAWLDHRFGAVAPLEDARA